MKQRIFELDLSTLLDVTFDFKQLTQLVNKINFYSEIEKMSKKFELPPEEIAELKEAFNLFDKVLTLLVFNFCA